MCFIIFLIFSFPLSVDTHTDTHTHTHTHTHTLFFPESSESNLHLLGLQGFIYLIEIFVEVFVDSHAVLKSNTEIAQVLFTQFLPMLIFCRTRVQYHNQDTDTIHLSFSDFPSFMCLCEGVCISHDCLI